MKRAFLVLGLIALFAVAGFAVTTDELEQIAAADNPNAEQRAALEAYEDGLNAGNVIDEAGGPDGMGYIYKDSQEADGPVYNWIDNTVNGTEFLSLSGLGDGGSIGPFPIGPAGETFTFYGVDYTEWTYESDGIIRLGTDVDTDFGYTNEALPTDDADLPAIFWMWDDMDSDNGATAYYSYEDVGGTMATVISVYDLDEYYGGDTQDTITAQIILFADGRILIQYNNIDATFDVSSESIGIQAGTAGPALEASYNTTPDAYPFNGLAIEFSQLPSDANLEGTVTDFDTGNTIEGATVSFMGMTATTDAAGFYNFDGLYSGTTGTVFVSADGYYDAQADVTIAAGLNTQDFALETLPGNITGDYFNDFEDNSGPFVSDEDMEWEWGAPTAGPGAGYSGANVWATTLDGNHQDTGGDSWLTSLVEIELTGSAPLLQYMHWFDYNDDYDGYNVQISTDGGTTWETLQPEGGYSGFCTYGGFTDQEVFFNDETPPTPGENEWAQVTFPLASYTGQNVKIAFRHIASTVVSYFGVAVDDLTILQEDPRLSLSGTVTDSYSLEPIEGATIDLDGQLTTTDASGFYTLPVVPGDYTLTVTADGFDDYSGPVSVVDQNVVMDVALDPQPLASVTGTVTHAMYGYPVEGATVTIGTATATTDADGMYSLTAFYYDSQIEVTHPDFPFYDAQIDLVNGDNVVDAALLPYNFDIDTWNMTDGDIPAGGGPLTYDVYIENNTGATATGGLWAEVQLPNGNMYPPAIWNYNYVFLPGYAYGLGLVLNVPAFAPAGDYVFIVNMGNYNQGIALYSDNFPFTKLGTTIAGQEELKLSGKAPVFTGPAISGDEAGAVSALPEKYELGNAYPNPFNPTANFTVSLPEAAELTVNVYNVMGQQVAQITNGTTAAGLHTFTLDGSALSSGVYFIHAQVPGELQAIQKVTLMK